MPRMTRRGRRSTQAAALQEVLVGAAVSGVAAAALINGLKVCVRGCRTLCLLGLPCRLDKGTAPLVPSRVQGEPEVCQACAGAGGVQCFACSGSGHMVPAEALAGEGSQLRDARRPRGRRAGECRACMGCGMLRCKKCSGSGYLR